MIAEEELKQYKDTGLSPYEVEEIKKHLICVQKRLCHLLSSDFISSFDKVNLEHEYIRDIKEADTFIHAKEELDKEKAKNESLKKQNSEYYARIEMQDIIIKLAEKAEGKLNLIREIIAND